MILELTLPFSWVTSTLGEQLARSSLRLNPSTSPGRQFTYVGLEHIEGITGRLRNVSTVYGQELRSIKNVFKSGEILYGRLRPYLNKVFLADRDGICSTEIWVFRASPTIDVEYATYYLRSDAVLERSSQLATGASLPRIAAATFDDIQIPLPPLPEQRRIVAILNQAERLRQLRREATEKAQELPASLYQDAFGPERIKQEGWPLRKLRELGQVRYGLTVKVTIPLR